MRDFIYPFPTGIGAFQYAPAILPADYVGPRLDCPLPIRGDDSPLDGKKYEGTPRTEVTDVIEEFATDLPLWVPAIHGPVPAPVNPALPGSPILTFPGLVPCCNLWTPGRPGTPVVVVTPPEGPQPAPVPLDGSGAYLGGALIGVMMIAAAWKIMPWLEAQKGASGWAADN